MKKAAIFDLDGTLIDSLPDIAAAMNRSLERFGLPGHPVESYRFMVGNGVFKLAERAAGANEPRLENVLNAYREDYAQNCRINSRVYPGISDLLRALKALGLAVCVLSNKDQQDVESVLSFYFPDFSFSVIRGRVENVPLKPDPAGALLISRSLEIDPEDCWYIGDTSTDICCGNAAGMETVGVLWGFRPREELSAAHAKHLIAAPCEMLQLAKE